MAAPSSLIKVPLATVSINGQDQPAVIGWRSVAVSDAVDHGAAATPFAVKGAVAHLRHVAVDFEARLRYRSCVIACHADPVTADVADATVVKSVLRSGFWRTFEFLLIASAKRIAHRLHRVVAKPRTGPAVGCVFAMLFVKVLVRDFACRPRCIR